MASAILPRTDFYVYLHCRAGDGTPFYVGKGRGPRSVLRSNRTAAWLAIAEHGYVVHTYKSGLTEVEALQVEQELIRTIGRDKLVNVTEGGRLGLKRKVVQQESHAEDLFQLKRQHQLTNQQIADLACVSIKTVESWFAPPGAANYRKMPERNLRLVRASLGIS